MKSVDRSIANHILMYFQRMIFKLLLFIGFTSLITSIGQGLYFYYTKNARQETTNEFLIKVLLGDKDHLWDNPSWIQVILAFIITVATLRTVFRLKLESWRVYSFMQNQQFNYVSKNDPGSKSPTKIKEEGEISAKDIEWLKQRTIHVKGLLP